METRVDVSFAIPYIGIKIKYALNVIHNVFASQH